jgi:uncharacterized repeat protein (TIGR01451 family)
MYADTSRSKHWTLLLRAACLTSVCCLASVPRARANPELKLSVDQHGDFILFGNTFAHECSSPGEAPEVPAPVVGAAPACASGSAWPYFRSDDPSDGSVRADASFAASNARTTAAFALPAGATVSYARLYWSAYATDQTPNSRVRIERPSHGLDTSLTADRVWNAGSATGDSGRIWYQSAVDITNIVSREGSGAFRVSDASSGGSGYGDVAWYIVLFYEQLAEPQRNLSLYEGLDLITTGGRVSLSLSGFSVPPSQFGLDAKLGVVAFDGDATASGDGLSFNGVALSDDQNPVDNIFNSTRSQLGQPVSVSGDLPRLTGTPRSMSGIDMDVLDISRLVQPSQTSATLLATSSGDGYLLGSFITSFSTLKPDFQSSKKSVRDLNGGAALPGDELEYEIDVINRGTDASVQTLLRDALPAGVSYVPNSIAIMSGVGAGDKTDDSADDEAEYDASTRTIVVRIGERASASAGGSFTIGESATLTFHVTIDAGTRGVIHNQGVVVAAGEKGADLEETLTDSDIGQPGPQTTDITVPDTSIRDSGTPDTGVPVTMAVPDSGAPPVIGAAGGGAAGSGIPDSGAPPVMAAAGRAAPVMSAAGSIAPAPDSGTPDLSMGGCRSAADCADPKPICDLSRQPAICVGCVTSLDCHDPAAPDCLTLSHLCACAGGTGRCQTDSDNDGVSDEGEKVQGTDPNDADTDDDGLLDGAELSPELDSDGDGLDNAHDADSDNDGLFDGTELGHDCDNPDTNLKLGRCRPDADSGKTTTNPLLADTDRGGVSDGSEDCNLNGRVDATESDPTLGHASDDRVHDSDGDGLSDELENFLHSDPRDGDTDDDGVLDGAEPNPSEDTDLDRLLNVRDPDSDDDGLFDGMELGRDCQAEATSAARGHCSADSDSGKTKTCSLLQDTDFGGARDGAEDANANGVVDSDERDPSAGHGADDNSLPDGDNDGLSDAQEKRAGSNPNDADSDDDGLLDGDESNPLDDQDGDGVINLLDPDSDGDGLFDGTERGKECTNLATGAGKMFCIADADRGATTTGELSPDTDLGSVSDGVEDINHNGRIDPGELDPNDPSDDVIGKTCSTDADCGSLASGLACQDSMCKFGCRGRGGNTCPSTMSCSVLTDTVGACVTSGPATGGRTTTSDDDNDAGKPGRTGTSANTATIAGDAGLGGPGKLEGGGCDCHAVRPRSRNAGHLGLWLALAGAMVWRRRKLRARRASAD